MSSKQSYAYAFGLLILCNDVNQVRFRIGSHYYREVDITKRELNIYYPLYGTSQKLHEAIPNIIFNRDELLEDAVFPTRNDVNKINGFDVYLKTDKLYFQFSQFLYKGLQNWIIDEQDTVLNIVLPDSNISIEDYTRYVNQSKNLLFVPTETAFISNIENAKLGYDKNVYTGVNDQPFENDDFCMGILDYASALPRFLKYKYPNYEFYQKADAEIHPANTNRIYVFDVDTMYERAEYSTHRVWHPNYQYIAQTEINLNGEFLTDDIQTLQTFVSDWNNQMDINKEKDFIVFADYDNINYRDQFDIPIQSKDGWTASLIWTDFLSGELTGQSSSKMFENANLYAITFQVKIVGIIARRENKQADIIKHIIRLHSATRHKPIEFDDDIDEGSYEDEEDTIL